MAGCSISPRLRALHIAQRAQVDPAQQRVGVDVVGMLVDLLLRGGDGLADAAELEVEVGEAVLQHRANQGRRLSASLYCSMACVASPAGRWRRLVLVDLGKPVVVVGERAVGIARCEGAGLLCAV